MALLADARAAFSPSFYRRFRKDRPLAPIYWRYFLPLYLVSAILAAAVNWHFIPWLYAAVGLSSAIPSFQSSFLLSTIAGLVAGALLILPEAWLLAACLRIAGAKCSFRQGFGLMAYSTTPSFLLGWIPLVNILAGLWALLLWFQGGKQALRTSYGTLLGGFLIFLVIAFAIALVVFVPAAIFAALSGLSG